MLGSAVMDRLESSSVTVVGLGAVGSHAIEALARSGIGTLRIVDFDVLSISNFNRQLLAVEKNVGRKKIDAAYDRLKAINPDMNIKTFDTFCHADTFDDIFGDLSIPSDPSHFHESNLSDTKQSALLDVTEKRPTNHVVIDAIDCLNPKVNILYELVQRKMNVVSCMGAARRTDPRAIQTGDISESSGCPLAKSVRKRLRRRGIQQGIHSVFSTEMAKKESVAMDVEENYLNEGRPRNPMGSLSMISGIFGYIAALEAIKILLKEIYEW